MTDRTSLQKLPGTEGSQLHTHLAHAIVRYIGLSSPQDLAEYGIHSAAELVDLISSVCIDLCVPHITLIIASVHD